MSSSIPPRKRIISNGPSLRTSLRAKPGGRNFSLVRSPKLFDRRARQRRVNVKGETEREIDKNSNDHASVEMSQDEMLEILKDEQNGGDFMTLDDEKKVKPADQWYVNCRDRAQWLPPLRSMATLTIIPSCEYKQPGCLHESSSKRGYGFLIFGEGTRRQNGIAELHMDQMSWSPVRGKTLYGTPWSPTARSGHVAIHLGQGRIFLYGGESNPSVVDDPLRQDTAESGREFVPGDSNQLVFDTRNYVWERYQPRLSPGPRYLPSLIQLTKKRGHPLCLIGGATANVQKKPAKQRKARRAGIQDTAEAEEARNLYKERVRPRHSISNAVGSSQTQQNYKKTEEGEGKKGESFATKWQLDNSVWLLDTSTMDWWRPEVSGPPPAPRMGHTASETPTGSLFVIGGMTGRINTGDNSNQKARAEEQDVDDDTGEGFSILDENNRQIEGDYTIYELRTTSKPMAWSRIQSHGVNPMIRCRALHSACTSPWDRSVVYIFGGQIDGSIKEDDAMLVLNVCTNEWTRPTTRGKVPAIRNGHAVSSTDSGDAFKLVSSRGNPKSSLETREVKMWIIGGSGRKGFEDLNIYELSINPPSALLEERGRWYNQVNGHWSYQKQRILTKPFEAWRYFVQQRRNEHVLAEHDDVLAGRLPKKSSHSFLILPELKQVHSVAVLQGLGTSYRQFQSVLKGSPTRNRVCHMSIAKANEARRRKMISDKAERKFTEEEAESDYLRKLSGHEEEKNSESFGSGVMASIFRNAIFDGSNLGGISQRPKSSPGLSRKRFAGSKKIAPTNQKGSLPRPATSQSRRRPRLVAPLTPFYKSQ